MKRSGGNKRENTRLFLFIFYPTILEPAFLLVSTSGDTSPIPNHLSFDSFRLSFQLKDGGTRSLSVTFIIGSIINGQFRCKMFLLIQCAAITGKPRYISFRFLNSIISCGHTTHFCLGKTDLPRVNSSKISWGKFISGSVLPRWKILGRSHYWYRLPRFSHQLNFLERKFKKARCAGI